MTVPAELLGARFDPARGPHVESWFMKASEPGGRRALWVRGTIFAGGGSSAPTPPVAEAWAVLFDRARGHVAVKSTVPLERARFARGALDHEIDGCSLSLGRARGVLEAGGRALAWDVGLGPERASPILHLPSLALYDDRVPSSKALTPLADARAEGTVRVRRSPRDPEERVDVAGWPAMVGHNWGRAHPHLYAWAQCNTWDGADDLVFEGLSTRVRMGPVLSPMATAVFVRWRGAVWDLNARELFGRNRGTISMRRWEATAAGRGGLRVHAEIDAETDDLVGLHYRNPGGAMTYCLSSMVARARVELTVPGGSSITATSRAAALEIGTRDRHHGVRMVA